MSTGTTAWSSFLIKHHFTNCKEKLNNQNSKGGVSSVFNGEWMSSVIHLFTYFKWEL